MKASELQGKAYLEMVCEFEDGGQPSEAYSRGVMLPMTGTTDWASLETSFRIEKGGRAPDKFKFNVAIKKPKVFYPLKPLALMKFMQRMGLNAG